MFALTSPRMLILVSGSQAANPCARLAQPSRCRAGRCSAAWWMRAT
jgi:hypothetical protein